MARGYIYDVKKIIYLSQEEGLNDRQIAEKMGCARETVTRIRRDCNIPVCNKDNRQDKTYVCVRCKKTVTVRRKERRRAFCSDCEEKK